MWDGLKVAAIGVRFRPQNWDMAVDEPVQNLHQYVEEDKCELPAFDPYAAPISSPGATSSMMSPSSSSNADHHNHPMASPTSSTAYTALSTSPPNWPTAATSSAASSSGSMSSPPSVPELEPGAPDNNLQSNSSCQMSISSSPEPVQTCSMASPTYAQNDDTQWDIFYFSESDGAPVAPRVTISDKIRPRLSGKFYQYWAGGLGGWVRGQ